MVLCPIDEEAERYVLSHVLFDMGCGVDERLLKIEVDDFANGRQGFRGWLFGVLAGSDRFATQEEFIGRLMSFKARADRQFGVADFAYQIGCMLHGISFRDDRFSVMLGRLKVAARNRRRIIGTVVELDRAVLAWHSDSNQRSQEVGSD